MKEWHIEEINLDNPVQLKQLVALYCVMWGPEPFGEFKKCPQCRQYFSEETIMGLLLTDCPKCLIPVEDAWDPTEVEKDIREQLAKTMTKGLVAIGEERVAGFAWTYKIDYFPEIDRHWGTSMRKQLRELAGNNPIIYFDELGVDKGWRRKGIGSNLAKSCLRCYQGDSNDPLVFLRTHSKSPALQLYLKLGLAVIGDDTEYGQGRVLLTGKLSELDL